MKRLTFNSLIVETHLEDVKGQKVQVLNFQGQINQTNSYVLSDNILIFFDSGTYDTILDFSKLEYINSVGLAVIIAIIRKVQENSAKIAIGGVHHKIDIILRLLDLPNKILMCKNVEEALAQWAP